MKMDIRKVCVYCASSDKIADHYFELSKSLGKLFAQNNIEVVFGGGSKGLMGSLADSMLQHNGKITGIMPKFMREVEWQHNGVHKIVYTESMAERKALLIRDIDAIIALPGGCGTLEELLEAITLKRLGMFTKPILIFNKGGFYDPLINMFDKCVSESFMRAEHKAIWSVVDEVDQVLEAIRNAPPWDSSAIKFAAV